MDNNLLQQARNYEEIYGNKITPQERPLFHVTPWVGWLNDPNGFSIYQGEYHLFYQYHLYNTSWGPMYWGHVKTRDFIRWEWLPVALAPDESYDNAGCFSGSALELADGRQLLMYTGVQEWKREDGFTESRQTQCLAFGDGINYQKYEANPVLTAKDLPAGGSAEDFRDPKVWWEEAENCYFAVVGNRPADGSGSILLFRSDDAANWEFLTVLDSNHNQYGKMWECPDFFQLGDTAVILTSPQEMRARGLEFHNGNGVICILGRYDAKTHTFERREVRAVDYGLDFYAPQTLLTPDGRRVMIGWMQSWESSHSQPHGTQWFGMMTIPRELSIKDGRLIQKPVRELERYRSAPVHYRDVDVRERIQLPQVSGRTVDMTVNVRPAGGNLYENFTIKVAKNTEDYTTISYNPGSGILRFDRSNSGFRHDIISVREVLVRNRKGKIKLRIIMDRFSVEVFVNNGEQVLSSTIYTDLDATSISFESNGIAIMDVEKYDIQLPERE